MGAGASTVGSSTAAARDELSKIVISKIAASELVDVISGLSFESRQKLSDALNLCEAVDGSLGIKSSSALANASRSKENANEKMQRILGNGDVRVVRLGWLENTPEEWILQRMQDLPDEAFSDKDLVAGLFQAEADPAVAKNLLIIVSYAWLSRRHPDPHGFHLRRLKFALDLFCEFLGDSEGIFMDFMSLPQADESGERTDAELRTFKEGLSIINYLYGSERTYVMQLTAMPTGEACFDGMNAIPYEKRGWCRFEETVSGIIKPSYLFLNIGNLEEVINSQGAVVDDEDCMMKLISSPKVPVSPAAMQQILKDSVFTNGSDTDKVANMYRTFFEDVSSTATSLSFAPLHGRGPEREEAEARTRGWQSDESRLLAEALPAFVACKELFLSASERIGDYKFFEFGGHPLGDDGVQCLATAMAKMPVLETLTMCLCSFGEDALSALQVALISSTSPLQKLSLPHELENTHSGKCFEKAWADAGKNPNDLIWEKWE